MVADWESSQHVHGYIESHNMTLFKDFCEHKVIILTLYRFRWAVNPRIVSLKTQRRWLRRWFSWHNADLVSMRTWVPSTYVEKVGVLVDVYNPGTVGWIGGRSRQILCCLSLLVCRLTWWWEMGSTVDSISKGNKQTHNGDTCCLSLVYIRVRIHVYVDMQTLIHTTVSFTERQKENTRDEWGDIATEVGVMFPN